jgi:pyruvate-formate lyase-activating enzyme
VKQTVDMLARERVANRPKHWVRTATACNSRCLFCLDSDTPRNVFLPVEEVEGELRRGFEELGADKVILSGGEATLHPKFVHFIEYAKQLGYDRVQTVTNGFRLADKDFMRACLDAGLGEITFSLHGHTEALHDHMTQTEGAFRNLLKGLMRALRDGRPIVNIDVVINKQNVAVLDKIVELGLSLGVREYDLLHVIPQAAAFENRDELFYDVREHLPVLQKVFRLNRHPGVTIWTNRFPISFLEGLEDLIQDPHKMLDEVNGRRFQVQRYLDLGTPLECRQPERCEHCFIEPFCTTTDRVVAAQRAAAFQVYWLGTAVHDGSALPYGCSALGVQVDSLDALHAPLPAGVAGRHARVGSAEPWPVGQAVPGQLSLVAERAEQLEAWLDGNLPATVQLEVELNHDTAPWLLQQRERLRAELPRLRLHQPSHEHLSETVQHDVRDPADFFRQLALPVRVSGLPACLCPGAEVVAPTALLDAALFVPETGRLDVHALAREHVRLHYHAKSIRCRDCALNSRCDGAHINLLRDQGLARLAPFTEGPEAEAALAAAVRRCPEPISRLANGRPPERPAPSLPGFPMPTESVTDPLALVAAEQLLRKKRRDELLRRAESH